MIFIPLMNKVFSNIFLGSLSFNCTAYLRDTLGSVPYHRNKVVPHHFFLFTSAYKSYVYTILWSTKCAMRVLCLKKTTVHALIKKYFIAIKCYHPSLQRVVIFLLLESLPQGLWLVTDQGGGC